MACRINEQNILDVFSFKINKMFENPYDIKFDQILPGDLIKIKFKNHKNLSINDEYLLIKGVSLNGDAVHIKCFHNLDLEKLLNEFLIDVAGSLVEERETRPRYRWFDRNRKDNFFFFKSNIIKAEIFGVLDCFGDVIHNGQKVRYYERNWDNKNKKRILEI